MEKIDFKKTMKALYNPPKKITEINVPKMQFLKIDGKGNPETSKEFEAALEALYGTAYTIKFMCKADPNLADFTVPPLEGLWWMENMEEFSLERMDDWLWTMMIMMPDFVTAEMVEQATNTVQKKKNPQALTSLRFEPLEEGTCVQTLYIGPYAEEHPTIMKMHAHIFDLGGELAGKHHEIYLNDPGKTAPEKLKTVLRQPYRMNGKK